jgi:hypothetical protein
MSSISSERGAKKKERNQLEIKTGDEWLRVGNRRRRAEAILISSDGPAIEDAYFIFRSLLPPKSPSIEPTDIQPSGNKLAISRFDIPAGMCK